jgi:autotransporter-associated beta strand protein
VYHVTTLADSEPGSFRDAVSQGNRTIIFDVGGYINLNSAVIASSGLTIAGQTAPGGGIGVMNNEVSFYGRNNIICRFFRFRQGGSATGSSAVNIGASSGTANNMIFDHISVEFGQWDSIDAVHTSAVTVQNSIIADPINQQFGAHVEGFNLTWYGNLWVNAHNRQPLCKADTIFINNVVYNYQAAYTTGDTGAARNHDIINNYFITGPSSTAPQDDFFQINGYPQNLYFTGNLRDSDRNGLLGGSTTTPNPDNNGRTGNILASPWSPVTPTIPTYSTVAAYRVDVSNAGALPRDPLDALIVSQVTSLGTAGAIITSPSQTGLGNSGFGTIDGGTALVDSDQDGMPDIWEQAAGSNPLVADNNTIAADGYTLLEHYLNWMAAPHAIVQTNAADIDLWPYTLGFTNGATYTFANVTNGTVTLANSHFAHFVPDPGFTGLASFTFIVSDPDGSAMTNTMGLLVSITYIPKNLVWRGDGVNNTWDTSTYGPTTAYTLANTMNVPPGTVANLNISPRMTFGPATNGGTLNVTIPGTANQYDYVNGAWTPFTGTLNLTGTVPNALLDLHFNGGSFDGGWGSATVNLNSVTLVGHHNSGGNTFFIGALNGTSTSSLGGSEYAGPESWKVGGLNLDCTFAGSISNYSATTNVFTKIGTGNLTLGGTNNLSGAMTVSNGTLTVTGSTMATIFNIAVGKLAGTGQVGPTVTVQSGASISPGVGAGNAGTLIVNSNLTLNAPTLYFDLSSSPSGANDQIVLQSGLLTMSGTQNYNFNLVNYALGAGTYILVSGAATNTASGVSLVNNLSGSTRQTFVMQRPASGSTSGYVQLVVSNTAGSLVWQGTNGNNWDNATTNWQDGSAADIFFNLDLVRFDDSASNGNVSIIGVVQPATVIVTNNSLSYTISNGVLAGVTSLTKGGSGTLILNSSNSFTGGTFVNGGTL